MGYKDGHLIHLMYQRGGDFQELVPLKIVASFGHIFLRCCYRWNCVPLTPDPVYVLKSWLPLPQNVTVCGDKTFEEVIKLKWL